MDAYKLPGAAVKAGGLLYVPDGLVVLVERFGSGRDGLVIPKGTPVPADAHLGETAERELLEETRYIGRAALFIGEVTRNSIDVDSPEARKRISLFLMIGDGTQDMSVAPDESVRLVDPREAAHSNIMRYSEEAEFVARHLGTLYRVRGWA